MKNAMVSLILVVVFSFCLVQGLQADEISELKAQIRALQERVEALERAQQESQEDQIATHERISKIESIPNILEGINIGASTTFMVQGSIDANAKKDATDATYTADIEIEKNFQDYAKAFIHLEMGDGTGLDSDELDLFSGVNRDTGDSDSRLEATEVWYEHYLNNKQLTLTLGKLDPTCYLDNNAIANDETTQFLSFAFRNSAAIEFPDNAPGLRISLSPSSLIEINAGILDDDADWEDVGDDLFSFTQVNLKPNFLDREGNWRLYGWYDNSRHTTHDSSKVQEPNYGFGLSLDQELTDVITVFSRFGWQDPDVSQVKRAWSTGLQIVGEPWGRSNDVLGIAIGQNIISDDYGKAGNPDDSEGHFELYYNLHINDHLSLTPDFQIIRNPKGESGKDSVRVVGLRTQVDF